MRPIPASSVSESCHKRVLELEAENERLRKREEIQRGMCDRREAEFKAETESLRHRAHRCDKAEDRLALAEAENERLRTKVSDTEDTIDRADEHTEMLMRKIEKLEEENERLRAQIKGRTLVPELVEKGREGGGEK